ncbi:hypothetical protein LTR70_003780 [Exophiala xenobiotica]|nr:hypothetical protein LTR70_003780 [Exophiala xenobiotica]
MRRTKATMRDSSRPERDSIQDDGAKTSDSFDSETTSDSSGADAEYTDDSDPDARHQMPARTRESEKDHDQKIADEYQQLTARRVDLVGDYAGNELFFIEGDSLLLQAFDDSMLDFSEGLQLLHAVYNVERLLHGLIQRKCNFKIVFFDSNKELCVPQNADRANASKYYLARAVIIRHLQANLATSQPQITIDIFQSWTSAEFIRELQETPPYFLMAHDGAQSARPARSDASAKTLPVDHSAQSMALRQMILFMAGRNFNVALINEMEFRDTKVMTMVLEARKRGVSVHVEGDACHIQKEPALKVLNDVSEIMAMNPTLTERQLLAVVVISNVLLHRDSKVSAPIWSQLCSHFLMHQALLTQLPLANRRLEVQSPSDSAQCFLGHVAYVAACLLGTATWDKLQFDAETFCDVADFMDGRLFLQVVGGEVVASADVAYKRMSSAVTAMTGTSLPLNANHETPATPSTEAPTSYVTPERQQSSLAVLAFSNPVFDKHLESVHLQVDRLPNMQSIASRKVFKEASHWHNAKKPLLGKSGHIAAPSSKTKWAARREQLFMAEMRTYAASLTNAVGKSLEPETIIVGEPYKPGTANLREADTDPAQKQEDSSASEKAAGSKKGGGGKAAAKNKVKQDRLDKVATAHAKKADDAETKILKAWQTVCKDFDADGDPHSRYRKAQVYMGNQSSTWRETIGAECELYMLNCLILCWKEACHKQLQAQSLHIPALIWSHVRSISQSSNLPRAIVSAITSVSESLRLPGVSQTPQSTTERKLAFSFEPVNKSSDLSIDLAPKVFQLLHCGPYLDRSFDSRPDTRVSFQPDDWQRRVLDSIDAKKSVFVVAPTSAGKTFISFYAMRKVLEADDNGVLIYVAPTKALVNQIAAEIQARYSKKFKYGGKSVWAIHTRDYRVNNATGCQVLVTVPHILQIMLMSPSNAKSWSSRIRCIIFDEIHSIGEAEGGVVYEQLLLMAPCPVVGLSATVGNPDEFSQWLAYTQESMGHELVTIQHPHRYSDLRKYFYVPPGEIRFNGLSKARNIGNLDLDGLPGFNYIHPVAALVDKSRGIPEDLALEPRDCFLLWQAMRKVSTEAYPVPLNLYPEHSLPEVPRKADILRWERSLKGLLQEWLEDPSSPYDRLLRELERTFRDTEREPQYVTLPSNTNVPGHELIEEDDYITSGLALLCRLHERDALPAILFNYDRHLCEEACKAIIDQLQRAETTQQKSGPRWRRKLEKWEEWKETKMKAAAQSAKEKKSKTVQKKRQDGDDEKLSKADMLREAASAEVDEFEHFDPRAPTEGYHFADHSKVQASELEDYIRQLRYREIPSYLIDALGRGIGVHHAGMNRKYRQVVEILFRKRFLRVVIATGTLALGINMPCKTVVFTGDSVYLTALNYRQCAGRSGRRGFDLLGNVVFHGISRQKVCRLISSRLPDLIGHFPITTSLVLRMFTLLHESGNSRFAVDAVNSVLSQPRLYMGGDSFKDQTMHHLRFSIEYLRRQHLLGADGVPLNFAGLVSHLYYTENSSFAFHALLKEGYFIELCAGINESEKDTLQTLMLVMSHLFNRVPCRRADAEFREKTVKQSSSMVFLPPLPEKAASILQEHNKQTLQVYETYVKTFVDQHISQDDANLPLTGTKFGGNDNSAANDLHSLPATSIRSSFVALSGSGDDFDSIHDLCSTTRSGVFLEEAVIPYMQIYPADMEAPLNAWLLDFFKHGDVITLERDNGIRRSEIWFFLNDFSLVLATIVTSLLNFMKLADVDMIDVRGGMDVYEEAKDDEAAQTEESSSAPATDAGSGDTAQETAKATTKKAKRVVKDSWDDDDGEEEGRPGSSGPGSGIAGEIESLAEDLGDWNIEEGGLRNVLKAFQKLQMEFNVKFRAMWA